MTSKEKAELPFKQKRQSGGRIWLSVVRSIAAESQSFRFDRIPRSQFARKSAHRP
jgi:hypothetical protein